MEYLKIYNGTKNCILAGVVGFQTRKPQSMRVWISSRTTHFVLVNMLAVFFLKAFVNAVKKNVDEVEESVTTAERELGSHTIQKVLSSIPGLRQVNLESVQHCI